MGTLTIYIFKEGLQEPFIKKGIFDLADTNEMILDRYFFAILELLGSWDMDGLSSVEGVVGTESIALV